jgi:hypothetical protein
MTPYETKLLIEIDIGLRPLTAERTQLLQDTILDFYRRGLITVSKRNVLAGRNDYWETTRLGRAVCNRLYAVDESGIKFCGECGRELP